MSKVRVTIRLYRIHDLDLITFVETHKLSMRKAMYCALTAFSKGEHFVINIPPLRDESFKAKKVYSMYLILDSEKDSKSIEILNKIKEGNRNNFMKNLLRMYLCNPMSETFLENQDDMDFFYQKFSIFREGKRVADAGDETKKYKKALDDKKEDEIDKIAEFKKETSDELEVVEEETQNHIENNNDSENDISNEDEDITNMFSSIISG